MEWIFPLAISLLILRETGRNNDRLTSYSVDYKQFSESCDKCTIAEGISKPHAMDVKNNRGRKRAGTNENQTCENVPVARRTSP